MNVLEYLEEDYLLFDGAMGSILQQDELFKQGVLPETLNILKPELIKDIHLNYLNAGSNVILTNTFGANPLKYNDKEYPLEKVIKQAIQNGRDAIVESNKQSFLAYDIGPLGQLLEPSGTLSFEDAYEAFSVVVKEAIKYDIDLFVVETIADLYEAKAAVLAIKEHSDLPVFVTLTFDNEQTTLLGNDVISMVATLEGLRVDAIGVNCSFGPKEMVELVKEIERNSSTYLMVQPNAGMPLIDGTYDIDAKEFLECFKVLLETNIQIMGGCCGTTYEHIKLIRNYLDNRPYLKPTKKNRTIVTSSQKGVVFDKEFIKIGERINPTGKPLLKEALLNNNYSFLIKEALKQEEEGAHILDINVGLPKIDEATILKNNIKEIQSYLRTPLQIDSANPKAIEAALRIYNGKPIINSINGKQENMDALLPLVAKYGGVFIGLCIDENGLATTLEDKIKVASKIVEEASKYGIDKKDIIIDSLTLTASAQQKDVKATIDAIRVLKEELGLKSVLGLSNVSFGLPNRSLINATFFSMARYAGLDSAIINTASNELNNAILASDVLLNIDKDATKYMANEVEDKKEEVILKDNLTIKELIIQGLNENTEIIVKKELENRDPIDIIENDIVSALDFVGNKFEKKELFLPQLIKSAQAASSIFDVIKKEYPQTTSQSQDKIILATVKGDVHDIGKNILKVILENYGYVIIDLGKDVEYENIATTIEKENIKLVGLSALMTTTVVSMEDIINKIRLNYPDVKVMVGGAVLNKEYAMKIDADYYCKDALEGVDVARKFFSR
ncbi:MAG: homocysteine S-methyltransferase family protein [Erysipelotrichales bacterium]